MVESTVLNPKDEKITHYFGEINGFLRSTCIVNTNNKKQMGVGGVGEMVKVFILILTLKSECILGVTGVIHNIFLSKSNFNTPSLLSTSVFSSKLVTKSTALCLPNF